MKTDIEEKLVRTPTKIVVDGVNYPITHWNIRVVKDYWNSGQQGRLNRLKNFAMDFGDSNV